MGVLTRRRTRNLVRFAGRSYAAYRAGQGLARLTKVGLNRGMSYTATRRKRGHGGQGITTQHDRSLIYRKRRMRKRLRNRWKRFSKKVLAVSEKDLGSRTIIRNDQVDIPTLMTTAAASNHNRWYFMLYGNTSGTAYYNDLATIGLDTDLGSTGKLILKSGILDMTVRNSSARLSTSLNPPITLEIDVYEITVGVELGQSGRAQSMSAIMVEGASDTATIPGHTTQISGNLRGWTPWDFPSVLSEYRVKIWKKTKYFLSENQTFTYQYRDPKRHALDKQRLSTPGEVCRGLSRYFYFVFKPTPGYIYNDATPDTYAISVGVTRKYLYKVDSNNQDFDTYNN